jgi:branched-subunit amino acid aminotransferase/4-amino-4-deoxychorismate lyase
VIPAELDGRPATAAELQALAMTTYGHFTTMRVEDGGVRGLGLHLERLVTGCRRLFDADLDRDNVRACVRHALVDHDRPIVARVTVFDPALGADHPGADAEPHVLVTTRAAPPQPCPPVHLRSAPYQRELPEMKYSAIFGTMWHRRAAQRAGFDDVVFVDEHGHLGELATASLAVVMDDALVWPDAPILPSVTAALLDQAHAGPRCTAPVSVNGLERVQAAVALSAVVGVRTIAGIDGWDFTGDHPVIAQLRAAYGSVPCEAL